MNYRLVIFDFDGTVADTFPWFLSVINDVAEKYNFKKVGNNDHDKLRMLDATAIVKYLNMPRWKLPMIAHHMHHRMAKDIEQISLFPQIEEMIEDLNSQNIQIGILSSNSRKNIEHILGHSVLSNISYLECGVSLFGKAHRMTRVLAKSAISKEDAIYIGDEVRDSKAAEKVGIAFGGVAWGYNDMEALINCHPQELFFEVGDISEKIGFHLTNKFSEQ